MKVTVDNRLNNKKVTAYVNENPAFSVESSSLDFCGFLKQKHSDYNDFKRFFPTPF
jgi:hypothetical protein